ncbi:MAG: hypothetical protein PHF33_08060, partial [Candidatus Delongbacteria bacterium]|nr:hypothetical protein [Candidatus Delongbacteria bacterium]
KNKPVIIALYGDKSRMDLQKLAEFGKIVELKKSDILKVETSMLSKFGLPAGIIIAILLILLVRFKIKKKKKHLVI